jgi:hypothetical protein
MPTNRTHGPEAELLRIAEEYRHLKNEHQRMRAEGAARRHMGARILALGERFARLVGGWEPDEERRDAWHRHLQSGTSPPPPTLIAGPLVFRGVRAGGSRIEVRDRGDGELDLIVDGVRAERLRDARAFSAPPGGRIAVGGVACREVFDAGDEALAALRAHVARPEGPPPWAHARELYEDGLIDVDFGLTARGRRALAANRPD